MKIDLTRIRTREQLVHFLQITEEDFTAILSFDPDAKPTKEVVDGSTAILSMPVFLRHEIPKRNRKRGYRIVWEPFLHLSVYKALARRLENYLSHVLPEFPHSRTFGYIGGKNIRENAWDHRGKKSILSVDIKDFFPSITTARIADFFRQTGINDEVAEYIARFVTIGGGLPLGFPTSPTISNAICLNMDRRLQDLADQTGSTFSRYADDISFSNDKGLPAIEQLRQLINDFGFELAEDKTRRSKNGQAHFVTGLSISDPVQPHVPRKKKRKLRQELYYASKFGLDDHFRHQGLNSSHIIQMAINSLDGLVKYVAFHEPKQSGELKKRWAKVLQDSGNTPSFAPKNQHRTPFILHIDEAEYERGGERILALGISVSQHQQKIDEATAQVLNEELSDIWAAGKRDAVEKRGVHFSDATQDLRLKYVEKIAHMPFEGYVAYARLPDNSSYESTYLRLVGSLITRRLMAAESRLALVRFEINGKVAEAAIRSVVSEAHDNLRSTNNRHPSDLAIEFVQKPHLGMSVPDFLLGILGLYLRSGTNENQEPVPRDKLLFERIRDKYRLMLDVDNWIEFTRRNPIEPW